MFLGLASLLISAIEAAGFTAFEGFSNIDTLKYKSEQLAFYSLENIKYSQLAYSFDGTKCGFEMSGHIKIKVLGSRNNYKDYNALERNILKLLDKLELTKYIVIQSLNREKIFMNQTLGRLEDNLTFDFKLLITDNVTQEESD